MEVKHASSKHLDDTWKERGRLLKIDSLDAQVVLLRTLLELHAFGDGLEESYSSIVACKDTFIQDLREKVEQRATSKAWSQQREASLHDGEEGLAAADIEFVELHLELKGAQRNAVMSTDRIIQLEVEASVARHRLQTVDVENRDSGSFGGEDKFDNS